MMPETGDTIPQTSTEVRASTPKEAKQAAFLAAYSMSLCVTTSAESAGVSREAHYKWLREDKTYPARLEEARVQAIDNAAAEAYKRATVGGSDTLLMFMLRGHSDRYRDKTDVRHSGPGGGPIVIGKLTDEIRAATTKAMSDPKVLDAMLLVGEALGRSSEGIEPVTTPEPEPSPEADPDGTGET